MPLRAENCLASGEVPTEGMQVGGSCPVPCVVSALETDLLQLQNESLSHILPEACWRESFQKGKMNRKI